MISIENMNEVVELDQEEIRGGLYGGYALSSTFLQSIRETVITSGAVNFTNFADNGSFAQIGGPVNITNVIGTNQITLAELA